MEWLETGGYLAKRVPAPPCPYAALCTGFGVLAYPPVPKDDLRHPGSLENGLMDKLMDTRIFYILPKYAKSPDHQPPV